ncbi:MAG: flippase-like domain-containing protein [Chloroflexi bacterium]|nr:flippase-like domain-containing protein [Chloroflexota bacterium]
MAVMRKFIIAVLLLLAVVFVYFSLAELETIVETLQRSDFRFFFFALLLAFVWLYDLAVTLKSLYRLVGIDMKSRQLMLIVAAANFVNVIAPIGGVTGMAVLLDDARQRNHSTGRVTVAGALFILLDYAAFICVLSLGWVVLIRRNNLSPGEITASVIILAIAIGMASLVYLGYRSSERLGNVLAWLSRAVNRVVRLFTRREYLQEANARLFASEFAEGLTAIKGQTHRLFWPFLFALNNKAILICILALSFLSFGTPFSVGTIIGGFSIGYLFVIVSPTPAGIGFMEGAMTLGLRSLQVPTATAALVTLAYRAATFWFPLLLGGLSFRYLNRKARLKPGDGQGNG